MDGRPRLTLAFFLLAVGLMAYSATNTWGAPPQDERSVILEVYFDSQLPSAGVPKALEDWRTEQKHVVIVQRDVQIPANAERFDKIARHFGLAPNELPAVYGCNQVIHASGDATNIQARLDEMLRIEVYVRRGCSRCAKAKRFLVEVQKTYPGFEFVYRDLVTERQASADLNELVRQHRKAAASVPVFHVCNQLQIGWDRDQTSGARLLKVLDTWTIVPQQKQESANQSTDRDDGIPLSRSLLESQATLMAIRSGAVLSPVASALWCAQDTNAASTLPDLPLPDLPLPSESTGKPPPGEENAGLTPTLPSEEPLYRVQLPWFGEVDARELGLPLFTLAIGLVDGFNPCAMWVLLFLLSLLVNLKSRSRILAVAGSFVVISGLAYFVFMAAWLNVFLLVGLLRPVQLILGCTGVLIGAIHVKDFFAFKKGITLSIPERAKPGIYAQTRKIITAENLLAAIVAASVLAVMVNIVELLCTAGLPALYTEVLANHNLPGWQNLVYLGLYIAAYMFDDSLMVGVVVVTLSKRKLQEHQGRWLKLVSGVVIILIGLVMLFQPEWLM